MSEDFIDEEMEEYGRPNKSLLKREAKELQELAAKLGELSESVWVDFGFTAELISVLSELKRIKQFGAKKRQMKLVAKMLRDEDVVKAKSYLSDEEGKRADSSFKFHQIELWRDRLIQEGGALTEFLSMYPEADVQHLRQLIRNAKKEAEKQLTPKAARILFKYIREITG